MLIGFSKLVLVSQLIITAADGVPRFDVERSCHVDNANTSGLSVGLDETTKACVHDEQAARDQLETIWSQFRPSDRNMCTANTTDISAVPPSYVALLTCLQAQRNAKKLMNE
jgi:hypothetical protein